MRKFLLTFRPAPIEVEFTEEDLNKLGWAKKMLEEGNLKDALITTFWIHVSEGAGDYVQEGDGVDMEEWKEGAWKTMYDTENA